MKDTARTIAAAALLAAATTANSQLIINELMQSNIDCVMDDLNEFPDSWVELYNSGTQAADLSAYSLADTDDPSQAWALPAVTVQPGGHVLVWCDKEAQGLHTPFRLESGKGCAVYLFASGAAADKVEGLKKQPAPNIAWGRQTDGADTWGYMATPTPGASNCGQTCSEILGEPVFGTAGSVVEQGSPIELTLSLPEGSAPAEIRYTTDGSEPTASSPLYQTPICIGTTTVVRAKLFADGYLSPRSSTQSYIFHSRKVTLPVISIASDSRYFYDNTIGILVDGTYNADVKNYEYDWRRPINFEFFAAGQTPSSLNQLCETRIMGGASRGAQLKSLALYANKRFGQKRFEYEFFPDQRPGISDFKSIALRNAGNDFDYLYMRDAIIQRTMSSHTDLDWQAWQPAIVYVNGEYKGMLNIRERSNEDNIYTNYDGLEDIDMFENWWELKSGTWDNYNAFAAFYAEHGHTLAEYEKWMDTNEFMNLMLMNLYYSNRDFPGNNIVMWRPRTDDGRWRFIAKDTDFGLGLYGSPAAYNTMAWIYNPDYDPDCAWANQYEHTRLFRRLMEDADFARQFIDRAAVYMGDFMNERGTRAMWDPMYEMIRYEYPYHRKLYNPWWPNYSDELTQARNWLADRTDNFYSFVAKQYGLGTPTPLTVNALLDADLRNALTVSINGIELSEGLFDGRFFAGRQLSVSATSSLEGSQVTGWRLTTTQSNGSTTVSEVSGSSHSLSMPSCTRLDIEALVGNGDGIDDATAGPALRWWRTGRSIRLEGDRPLGLVEVYNALGVRLGSQTAAGTSATVDLPASQGPVLIRAAGKCIKVAAF